MTASKTILLTLAFAAFATASSAATKTYQVTGPVVESDASHIVVMKGKDKWELAKDASTKAPADIKAGDKVTIQYTMTAVSVDSKATPKTAAKPAVKTAK